MTIDTGRTRDLRPASLDADIIPALTDYIRIPAKSPMYDTKWAENGHIDRAVTLITDWARARKIEGLTLEVVRLPGRTPVILMEVPGTGGDTVLLYGHCDKQPEMVGWAEDAGPWVPDAARRPALRPRRRATMAMPRSPRSPRSRRCRRRASLTPAAWC